MAFRVETPSLVATTASEIFAAVAGDLEVWISADSSAEFWISGDSGVTNTNGFPVLATTGANVFRSRVRPGDEIWAWCGSNLDINVLVRSA